MSQAASQWSAFAREVAKSLRVWTVRDKDGFPAMSTSDGKPAQPFWSSLSRVERIVHTVVAYSSFQPHELSWNEFRDRWLPGLERDGLVVGVNWSGPRATGYDIEPSAVRERIEYEISSHASSDA
jgi:hypothetical protein